MAQLPEHDAVLRDKVRRLMGVLRRLAVAKSKPVLKISGYQSHLLLADAARHITVRPALGPEDEVLRAERIVLEPEPPCPREILPWVRRTSGAHSAPVLVDARLLPGDEERTRAVDVPGLAAAFERWSREWQAWAVEDRLRRPRAEVHQKLFELHRMARERPESVELVLAAGLLHAPGDEGEREVRIHLITQSVIVEQDPATGDMVCALAPGSAIRLEAEELLAGLPLFDQTGNVVLRDRLFESVASPLDPALAPYLKEWADRSLTTSHKVSDEWTLPMGETTRLAVTPSLVARQRGAFALREYYDAITKSLADDATPVPLGLAQLVEPFEPGERLSWLERNGGLGAAELAEDPLFPLPANEDQAEIINRLSHDSGVVVEGPPGTGKTHTIANLVSALLARGQRILVTAEKAQALRVLRDKLPHQMRDLCVSLTDSSARGNSDLTRSVSSLAGTWADFNPTASARTIADLSARRTAARSNRAAVLERIRALRESETYRHPDIAPEYGGTLADIAKLVGSRAETDGWVPGAVVGDLPLDPAELVRLTDLVRTDSEQRRSRRGQQIPPADTLPSDTAVANLVAQVERGDVVNAADGSGLVAVLAELPGQALHELDTACLAVTEANAELRAAPTDVAWATGLVDTLLGGTSLVLWQRAAGLLPSIDTAIELDGQIGFTPVAVAPAVDPESAAAVYQRFAAALGSGKSVRKLFKSDEQKAVEAIGQDVLVNGAPVTTAEAAATAEKHLRVLAVAKVLASGFAPLGLEIPLGLERTSLVERLRQIKHVCTLAANALAAKVGLDRPLSTLPVPARPRATSLDTLDLIASVAAAVAASNQAALARAELNRLADGVVAAVPVAARPPELENAATALRELDTGGYRAAMVDLELARHQQSDQTLNDRLAVRLRTAAPALYEHLTETVDDPCWRDRQARWPHAWAWSTARQWIEEQSRPGREAELDADLDNATREIAGLTADLAAAKAWKAAMERMTARQVQALQSYRSSIAGVGKGTGKYAEQFRQAAREAMAVAQEAVPAWVMPVRQVLSSIPPTPNAFDVVIVDEASQAELTSSFLLWLAPRVIVVGDDKQCTPSEIGAGALDPIFQRLETELPDVPRYLRADLTPRSSIFSMLRSRFGQMVRLREHFRCMPEIINWSSNEFYRDAPLVPVRQFGADRLPPLRTTYVEGAYVEGGNATLTNPLEAAAIADSIMACLADPAYDGKTFGVVVLQGQKQVELINSLLGERMSTAEWTARGFRVGTPPDFQGDERHVVWLSLVVAPEQNFAPLTRDEYQRRFNVAASRAQDQLWLFHSVTADRLRASDLRNSLLTYMLGTGTAPLPDALTGVSPDQRHTSFDSLFEQRVFLDITARGYHVTPQVETNGRRIDLVVTGASGKLAVECDGDAFHTTPEQRAADLQREQELKRCGWTFWRVRESRYYLDRAAALTSLWSTLDSLGIAPHVDRANPDRVAWQPTTTAGEEPEDDFPDTLQLTEPITTTGEPTSNSEPLTLFVSDQPAPFISDPPALFVPDPAPVPVPPPGDLAAALLRQAESAPLSTTQVAQDHGISTAAARETLTALVAAGRLIKTGQTRGTRYVLPPS
ncbi:AAA domain-containing protein [Actinokineospora enzanensis]|uniref:AAA domain-containing protein n=1 Tax=Actinokineospora enzanensis TaxID=155975 RepID=UPI00035FF55D|nr:AAA domain-containing protein [Actinokineospora enzanensis]